MGLIPALSGWAAVAAVTTALAVLGVIAVALAIAILRRRRSCPSCGVELTPLRVARDGAIAAYEVMCCPRCSNAVTLVHGVRHRFAHCPDCHQRTLETPCIRLPDSADGHRRVEVHESCHLCAHHAIRELSDGPWETPMKRGLVLPFRPKDPRTGTGPD